MECFVEMIRSCTYVCIFYHKKKKKIFFSIVRIWQAPENKAPRHHGIGKILNLPSSSLIHFLERKQKVNTRSHISLDDLPPNCWKQWSKVNCLHLEPSVAEVLHSKLGALVHGLAGFGAVSDTEKNPLYYQFTCDSIRVLIFQNPQGASFYLYNLQTEHGRLILAKSQSALWTPYLSSKPSNEWSGWTLTYPQNVSNTVLKRSSQSRAHINSSLVPLASFSDHCFPVFLPFGLNKAFLMWPLFQVLLEPLLVLF